MTTHQLAGTRTRRCFCVVVVDPPVLNLGERPGDGRKVAVSGQPSVHERETEAPQPSRDVMKGAVVETSRHSVNEGRIRGCRKAATANIDADDDTLVAANRPDGPPRIARA